MNSDHSVGIGFNARFNAREMRLNVEQSPQGRHR